MRESERRVWKRVCVRVWVREPATEEKQEAEGDKQWQKPLREQKRDGVEAGWRV